MDFEWSDEQLAFRDSVARFAEKELNDRIIERDKTGEFNWSGWKKGAEFGILGLPIPSEFGGGGADVLTTLLAMEGLGYGCRDKGLTLAIGAHVVICEIPIWQFGSDEQKQRYLPRLCSGEWVGAYGLTEPEAGSDAFSLRTRATRRGDKYVLNGTKMFITNGPITDLILTFATIDPSKGPGGVTAFLVEKRFPGFGVSRELDKMGLRTSPTGELVFEDCEVPVENRIGEEGQGAKILHGSLEWERACLLAPSIGTMERQLEVCIQYVKQRKQFGRPIGKFQSVANRIAEMKVRLETARMMLYKVGWLKQRGRPAMMEAAIAKLHLSECRTASALDAIQVHGGYGYMTEFEVERDLRDSVAGTIGAGSSEIQRVIIARLLGL